MRADERKKVENKESRRNYTEQAKPTETGLAILFSLPSIVEKF